MNKIPTLDSYSPDEWAQAEAWPAVTRYRYQLSRPSEGNSSTSLRLKRHDLWLRCVLATFFNRATAREICEFWSDSADLLIREAWQLTGCEDQGWALIALGKLGSRELNLSSDVDLIAIREDGSEPDLKTFRQFQNLLSEVNEYGFCLRVDFTLSPFGACCCARTFIY